MNVYSLLNGNDIQPVGLTIHSHTTTFQQLTKNIFVLKVEGVYKQEI